MERLKDNNFKLKEGEARIYKDEDLMEYENDNLEPCELFDEGLPMGLELWCNMEVESWLARRDMKRKLKSHVLCQIEGKDGIYQTKYHPTVTDGSWQNGRRILNDMSEADALDIWRAN